MRRKSPRTTSRAKPRRTSKRRREPEMLELATEEELNPYLEAWLALTPAERLLRSWEMRHRLVNPRAVHDEKLFPRP